jgi:hypothetical protein
MHTVFFSILGGERLKESYMTVFRNGRKKEDGGLTENERNLYLECLGRMENEWNDFSHKEIHEIFGFIERSIAFYLTQCAGRIRPRETYEGCMENLLFLAGYLLHYHFPRVQKEDLMRLYDLAVGIKRFEPCDTAELIEYEIDSGLLENLYFFLEYYYFR